jgi:hypothetical protein
MALGEVKFEQFTQMSSSRVTLYFSLYKFLFTVMVGIVNSLIKHFDVHFRQEAEALDIARGK